jgi:hypothetical protein
VDRSGGCRCVVEYDSVIVRIRRVKIFGVENGKDFVRLLE